MRGDLYEAQLERARGDLYEAQLGERGGGLRPPTVIKSYFRPQS